jgi:hypothetical protein
MGIEDTLFQLRMTHKQLEKLAQKGKFRNFSGLFDSKNRQN